ncbi:hypothetical protein CLV24_11876 [Pontibacter ummariensis]|uniref:Uncharacterized protein n=1 Tax=Pontibacter ummariensis TaxID=1610492 RepID=A0A239IME9_9BACT|nr:hypothetical protein [Pontibacter ummariensis]PRY09737.1 hypothetical protein CLV24_11876 [Pontibacter ummariensis]SNS94729.1 hypothetical protein SAMN06296052_11812 [Pontibacter ummariensis]
MENQTEFLSEPLAPLEDKIQAYLDTERDIRLLEVELLSLQSIKPDFVPDSNDMEKLIHSGKIEDKLNDKERRLAELMQQYRQLREEVIAMLPAQNTFYEINIGYGPSRVGYFTIDQETHQPLTEPVLHVFH